MESSTSPAFVDPNMTVSNTSSFGGDMSTTLTDLKEKITNWLKQDRSYATVLIAILVALAIFVFSHEKLYELTNQYIGETVDKDGTPSTRGLLLHSVLAGLVVGLLVYVGFNEVVGNWRNKL